MPLSAARTIGSPNIGAKGTISVSISITNRPIGIVGICGIVTTGDVPPNIVQQFAAGIVVTHHYIIPLVGFTAVPQFVTAGIIVNQRDVPITIVGYGAVA